MYPHVYKRKKSRPLRNIIFTVVVLLVLAGIAGIIYVYFTGKNADNKKVKKINTTPEFKAPKHVKPAANVPEYAALESLITPVPAGSNTSINVRALPQSICTISVAYNDTKSKDSGLTPKITDDFGFTSWTWTVDKTAPAGKWPVRIMCYKGKKSALLIANLQVTK